MAGNEYLQKQQFVEIWRNGETKRWHVALRERTVDLRTGKVVGRIEHLGVSKSSYASDGEAALAASVWRPDLPFGDELRNKG